MRTSTFKTKKPTFQLSLCLAKLTNFKEACPSSRDITALQKLFKAVKDDLLPQSTLLVYLFCLWIGLKFRPLLLGPLSEG